MCHHLCLITCRRTAEELAENHPVVASILQAKTRKYAGTYKVDSIEQQQPELVFCNCVELHIINATEVLANSTAFSSRHSHLLSTAAFLPLRSPHLQVHLDALLSVADRPPGELLSELVSLASAHEIGFDLGKDGALVWRLERQPEEWREMVDNMVMRLDQVGEG